MEHSLAMGKGHGIADFLKEGEQRGSGYFVSFVSFVVSFPPFRAFRGHNRFRFGRSRYFRGPLWSPLSRAG